VGFSAPLLIEALRLSPEPAQQQRSALMVAELVALAQLCASALPSWGLGASSVATSDDTILNLCR
jgi:hypothetical protein